MNGSNQANREGEMANREQAVEVVKAYLDGWRDKDKEAWLALFSDDAEIIDPVGAPGHRGKDAIGAFWDRVTGTGMKMSPELHKTVVCGDEVVAQFTLTSTAGGMGMAVDIIDVFTLDADHRIKLLRAYWDQSCTRMVTG